MKQGPRIYYTASQKALMWERWKEGESLHQMLSCLIEAHGATSRWRGQALTLQQLETITRIATTFQVAALGRGGGS